MQEAQTPKKKNNRREVGQSLVELALSGMLLATLLSGMLDFGRMYFTYVALEDSAGEAALFLSLNPQCYGEDLLNPDCDDPNNARWRAFNAVGSNLEWTDPPTSIFAPDLSANPTVGDTVHIQIRHDYTVITPLMQAVLNLTSGNDTITLEANAQQIVVSEG